MDFPRYVCKHNANAFYLLVKDVAEYDKSLSDGWYDNILEAMAPKEETVSSREEEPEPAEAPPTRAEIEAKCDELKIKHDKRYSDGKLLILIAEKLKG